MRTIEYDESTARIYAESIRKSIQQQSSESKISSIEDKIKKFPRMVEHLLDDLITHRKAWLLRQRALKSTSLREEPSSQYAYSKMKINNTVNDTHTNPEVRAGLLAFDRIETPAKSLKTQIQQVSSTLKTSTGNAGDY